MASTTLVPACQYLRMSTEHQRYSLENQASAIEKYAENHGLSVIAYFHKPLFSSGGAHGNDPEMKPLWNALYHAGAEVIINGHDHNYERFAPQDPDGKKWTLRTVFASSWSAAAGKTRTGLSEQQNPTAKCEMATHSEC
jgi:resolvase-like protein